MPGDHDGGHRFQRLDRNREPKINRRRNVHRAGQKKRANRIEPIVRDEREVNRNERTDVAESSGKIACARNKIAQRSISRQFEP